MAPWKAALGLIAALALPLAGARSQTADTPNPDWPCVQHKVDTLTSAQMWDGPPADGLTGWRNNEKIGKLIPVLANRRVPLEKAAAAIETFAAAQPQETRDEALALLFAGLLKTVNDDRAIVMRGIERFQRRQRARAAEIERQGVAIRRLTERAAADETARAELTKARQLYDWDVRIFRERQEAVPIACEIPVLIEQRLFALAREIRSRMQN